MSRPRRRASAATVRRQADAAASRKLVHDALRAGAVLTIGMRTDIAAGTVHAGTAGALLRQGAAARVPDPDRDGWTLNRIAARALEGNGPPA